MAADYATVADLKVHWPGLTAEQEPEAAQKLHEASIEVRALYPSIDTRLAAGTLDPDVPRLVVCRMVKRAMDVTEVQNSGFENLQIGSGPFTMGGKVLNPDGNVYLSAADRRLLGSPKPPSKAFTIIPGG